jgi:hypothetical protein
MLESPYDGIADNTTARSATATAVTLRTTAG